jgi:phage-related protein
MATGSRTLKLSILADVDDLKKKLGEADKAVAENSSKIAEFGKKAAVAFAVAGAAAVAYAGKLAVDGVKSAIEDEQAQLRLAAALKSATGATDAQIKATEEYIRKTQLATGITDNELRESFQRLSVSTKNATKSQELLTMAIDISKGSGKDLGSVVEALSKAYEGQDTKLVRLGIGISQADAKAMDFNETTKVLTNLYGGAASANAETFQGRIDRLKQAFEEAKEEIGYKLLPIIEAFVKLIIEQIIPRLQEFAAYFDPIKKAIMDNKETFQEFGQFIVDYVVPVLVNVLGGALKTVGTIAGTVIDIIAAVIKGIQTAVDVALAAIRTLIAAYNAIPILPNIGSASSGVSSAATSGATAANTGATAQQLAAGAARGGTTVNNITVQSVDSEGAARAVAKVLNESASRSVPQLYNSGITRAR